jgi:crossover junction endodeoxyribonuclease RuvC
MKSTSTRPSRVLAFDPGYERLGVAVVEKSGGKETLVHSECVRTPATITFPERLLLLGEATERLIKKFRPDAMALEEVFFAKNEKTAIKIAEVRGMLSYIAGKHGLKLHEFTPLEVKVAITGYGKSARSLSWSQNV